MMLGYLLARAGVKVVVLEKHADFLRDFRGDTVHPSTLEVMNELGLYDDFMKLPHQEVDRLSAQVGDEVIQFADFRHLPTRAKFVALTPQWDFLNFLADKGKRFAEFTLVMCAEVTELLHEGGQVTGVRAKMPDGTLTVSSALVVGADGRTSTVRDLAGLEVDDLGAPMDVLWMRLPREPGDEGASIGRAVAGRIFVQIPRCDYFQCGFVVRKGEADAIIAGGMDAFRRTIETISPMMKGRTQGLTSWDDVKLLTVSVDRLKTWAQPGLLCIGDAAHAMSPVGGVGINLAIQDAVAAANLLHAPLRSGRVSLHDLEKVQARRWRPTQLTQSVQLIIQKRLIGPTLSSATLQAPAALQLMNQLPWLQRLPARAFGLGLRFERVRSPDVHASGAA
jgi:2-polyprenyl-6-methoxyphenol hydroxylase-like FAD-dependent oxidoreductase